MPSHIESNLINENVLQQMIKDTSADVIPMLIDHYLAESRQRIQIIQTAVQNQDIEQLEFEIHTLGSTALALGNQSLGTFARKIEQCCLNTKTEQAFSLCSSLFPLADNSFQALEQRKLQGFLS